MSSSNKLIEAAAPIYAAMIGPRLVEGSEFTDRDTGGIEPNRSRFYAGRALLAAGVLLEEAAELARANARSRKRRPSRKSASATTKGRRTR